MRDTSPSRRARRDQHASSAPVIHVSQGAAPSTSRADRPSSERSLPLNLTTRSLLSHAAIFLSGVFVALLIATMYLNITAGQRDASHGADGGTLRNALAGGDGGSKERVQELFGALERHKQSLVEERRKTQELREQLSQLQTNRENGASASSPSAHGSSEASSAEDALREELLHSFNAQHDRIHGSRRDEHPPDFCDILPRPAPTALSLWSHHLPHVFNATRPEQDAEEYKFHDFTAQLLRLLTPDRLQRGVKALPRDWTPVERALGVVGRRLAWLRTQADRHRREHLLAPGAPLPAAAWKRLNNRRDAPRRLGVLVMGGSVTMGVVCHLNPVTDKTGNFARRQCAWPGRMAHFFARLFRGYELFSFDTVTLGGTNTASGTTIWDYSLLPAGVPYPDVVVNAYATNDMHYNSAQDALARNVSLAQSVRELNQAFVRQVLTPKRGCGRAPPLLLYLDDYLGNEQAAVAEALGSSQTIGLLAGYYGFGAASYGDAVRDLVYGDARETWLSSDWYEEGVYGRAVHPHMGMHIGTVWVVAFYLINLATTYCSLPPSGPQSPSRRHHAGVESTSQGVWDYNYQPIEGMLPVLKGDKELVGGPKAKPRGLPPPLTDDLSLEHISQLWKDDSDSHAFLWSSEQECSARGHANDDAGHETVPKPCIFSWVANLERGLDKPQRLQDKLRAHLTSNEGWSAADDNGKLGWVPSSGRGSKFALSFPRLTQPVRAVTWMIMRSYGDKWEGSTLRVEVWSGGARLASEDIVGFHDKKTSETYNVKMRLGGGDGAGGDAERQGRGGAAAGSDLKITFELTRGTTFKISGMAICDH